MGRGPSCAKGETWYFLYLCNVALAEMSTAEVGSLCFCNGYVRRQLYVDVRSSRVE